MKESGNEELRHGFDGFVKPVAWTGQLNR